VSHRGLFAVSNVYAKRPGHSFLLELAPDRLPLVADVPCAVDLRACHRPPLDVADARSYDE
jgi:hypothetical protein